MEPCFLGFDLAFGFGLGLGLGFGLGWLPVGDDE